MNQKDKIVVFVLLLILTIFFVPSESVKAQAAGKAALTKQTGYTIDQDALRKLMSKKLGTPYRKMDCSAYAAWVLENLGEKGAEKYAIKDVNITSGYSTYVWKRSGKLKISYKPAIYNEKKHKWIWGKRKKIAINKGITTWKSSKKANKKAAGNLEIGDALLYKNEEHIAYYFGEFSSVRKVVSYLKSNCGMKKLKKGRTAAGNICYKYKGKVVLIQYADCGTQWRIHATSSYGIVIDNDLTFHNGSFGGKWYAKVKVVDTTAE